MILKNNIKIKRNDILSIGKYELMEDFDDYILNDKYIVIDVEEFAKYNHNKMWSLEVAYFIKRIQDILSKKIVELKIMNGDDLNEICNGGLL